MIRRLQALNFRCLRYVDVELGRFHILVGPNASGKSTLFDAIVFLGELVSKGLEAAVECRTSNFQDLVWGRPPDGLGFELAVEFRHTGQAKGAVAGREKLWSLSLRSGDSGNGRRHQNRLGTRSADAATSTARADPTGVVPGTTAVSFLHTHRRQSAWMAHRPEQVTSGEGQLQYRDFLEVGKGLGDEHRVRTQALGAG